MSHHEHTHDDNEDDDYVSDFPDYDALVHIAQDLYEQVATHENDAQLQSVTETVRASLRNHIEATGNDATDKVMLTGMLIGALFTVTVQTSYTPLGATTAIIPAAIANMLTAPLSEDDAAALREMQEALRVEYVEHDEVVAIDATTLVQALLTNALVMQELQKKQSTSRAQSLRAYLTELLAFARILYRSRKDN